MIVNLSSIFLFVIKNVNYYQLNKNIFNFFCTGEVRKKNN